MTNIKMTLEYDGTRYQGWQRPPKAGETNTISYRLSDILRKMTGETVSLFCGAKTEPGVHAAAQVVSFSTASPLSLGEIRNYMNTYLPQDIAVLDVRKCPERFRADLNASSRTYVCRVCTLPEQDIFTRQYSTHLFPAPDITLMQEASLSLTGRHDFRHFTAGRSASGKRKKGTEKELLGIGIHSDGEILTLTFTATDFLYKMPAFLAGALLDIGLGRRPVESAARILDGTEPPSAPCEAKALLLKEIRYPDTV